MDFVAFSHRIKLIPPMNSLIATSDIQRGESSFRWIISHATSSHQDYGPGLIAVRVDAGIVTLLREFLGSLNDIVVRGRAMAQLQWLGARVEFLRENEDELESGRALAGLQENTALILETGADLPTSCLTGCDMLTECDAFNMIRVSGRFAPEVYASARIKNTSIEVESKNDLWPLIEAAFPV